MAKPYKKPTKIKIILLATITIALGSVIAIYIHSRPDSNVGQQVAKSEEPDATLLMDKIQQTATRDGKKEWHLEARSGHLIEKTQQLILKDVKVTFFLEDNSEILLTADQGILKTNSKDMEVSGNVVLKNNEYKLLTNTLSYQHKKRVVFSKSPVKISGTSAQVAADSLKYDLNAKKLTMEGGVGTTIDENVTL
ncbi:MAG: LPS export ABC transporter periplasmic protein LptC [Desulfobacterales bacterium]|jgi:LPS export ABC transporter protein LptC|nr:LPS export ABC transporter periplasmic protein LptC [Deltaproteobacteria bacterium]